MRESEDALVTMGLLKIFRTIIAYFCLYSIKQSMQKPIQKICMKIREDMDYILAKLIKEEKEKFKDSKVLIIRCEEFPGYFFMHFFDTHEEEFCARAFLKQRDLWRPIPGVYSQVFWTDRQSEQTLYRLISSLTIDCQGNEYQHRLK